MIYLCQHQIVRVQRSRKNYFASSTHLKRHMKQRHLMLLVFFYHFCIHVRSCKGDSCSNLGLHGQRVAKEQDGCCNNDDSLDNIAHSMGHWGHTCQCIEGKLVVQMIQQSNSHKRGGKGDSTLFSDLLLNSREDIWLKDENSWDTDDARYEGRPGINGSRS